jgi:hypothetical protein
VLAKIPNNRQIGELYSRGELVYKKIVGVKQQLMNFEKHLKEL